MKPVTAYDVARLSDGRVTDEDEQNRIFKAIAADPDLERLFLMLTEDWDESLPESPELAARLAAASEWQSLLAKSRLCGLSRGLPSTSNSSPSPVNVNMTFEWSADAGPATCCFQPMKNRPGVWRLRTSLPAHIRVLGLIAAVCRWDNSEDLTRCSVHADWSSRPLAADVADEMAKKKRSLALDSTLAAMLAATPAARSTDHRGETLNLDVAGCSPWCARVIRINSRHTNTPKLFPVVLTALDGADQPVACQARLMSQSAETLTELFPDCTSRVASLEVRPLPLKRLCRLTSTEAEQLIGSQPYSLRSAERVPDCPGDYIIDLSDAEIREHLDHTDSVLCLQVVEMEKEVQS